MAVKENRLGKGYMQKELFGEIQKPEVHSQESVPAGENQSSPLERIRVTLSLEKVLFLGLVYVVGFVLAYSLGFQNGQGAVPSSAPQFEIKRALVSFWDSMIASKTKDNESAKIEDTSTSVQSGNPSSPKTSTPVEASVPDTVKLDNTQGVYTIQLVTYKSRSRADQEVKALQERGLESFVIPSGKYYQVCVHKVRAKDEASKRLSELKAGAFGQVYSGAYIRPVKR